MKYRSPKKLDEIFQTNEVIKIEQLTLTDYGNSKRNFSTQLKYKLLITPFFRLAQRAFN